MSESLSGGGEFEPRLVTVTRRWRRDWIRRGAAASLALSLPGLSACGSSDAEVFGQAQTPVPSQADSGVTGDPLAPVASAPAESQVDLPAETLIVSASPTLSADTAAPAAADDLAATTVTTAVAETTVAQSQASQATTSAPATQVATTVRRGTAPATAAPTTATRVTASPTTSRVTTAPTTATRVTASPSTTRVTTAPSTTRVTTAPSTTRATTAPTTSRVTTAPPTTAPPSTQGPQKTGFAGKAELAVSFTFKPSGPGRVRLPYIAVWVEDDQGRLVDTISLWFQNDVNGEEWLLDLRRWYAAADGYYDPIFSSHTRAPGSYEVVWDGRDIDGKAVPPGNYVLYVESAREHGPYTVTSTALPIGDAKLSVTLKDTRELLGLSASLRPLA